MAAIACFGELLLRFSPQAQPHWIGAQHMPVHIGGAELNVARALALWGHRTRYITALPPHYLADEILAWLAQQHIDCSHVLRTGDRLGTYYLPQGTDLKHGGVIYDRAHSAFWQLQPGQIDWEAALNGCSWLHLSAISPALNASVAAVCTEAAAAARAMGLQVSVDLNYRARLWQYGVPPPQIMQPLVAQAHVLMGNMWAADALLGIASPLASSQGQPQQVLLDAAAQSMQALQAAFPQVHTVAYTLRLPHSYQALLLQQARVHHSPLLPLAAVADAVGSGDCMMAGLLHGLVNDDAPQDLIAFAAAAAANKLGETGDATQTSAADIWKKLPHGPGNNG
ncbi:MAG: sugar kinase [Chitinophagaceae bacterium]|nr:sugar kinase [Chitinophagaceae bacterium]